jgi:hypothetical protein
VYDCLRAVGREPLEFYELLVKASFATKLERKKEINGCAYIISITIASL